MLGLAKDIFELKSSRGEVPNSRVTKSSYEIVSHFELRNDFWMIFTYSKIFLLFIFELQTRIWIIKSYTLC